MAWVYLIRHPLTRLDPLAPASSWQLSPAGHDQVQALMRAPFWADVAAVYTSTHYKTIVVGEAACDTHCLPTIVERGLDEAWRDCWLGATAFQETQLAFFTHPDQVPAPGWETAEAAQARFAAAMDRILARHAARQSIAVVTHATVLTLYLAHLRDAPPSYQLWRAIGFAEVMAVDRATMVPATTFVGAPYDAVPHAGSAEPQP